MVVLPHGDLIAEHVGNRHALERLGKLERVCRAGFVHGSLDELEDRAEASRVKVEIVLATERARPFFGVSLVSLDGDVLVKRHHGAHSAAAVRTNCRRPAAEVRVHGVVADFEPRIHASLDEE